MAILLLGEPRVKRLVPTMRQDATVVAHAAGPLDRSAAVTAELRKFFG